MGLAKRKHEYTAAELIDSLRGLHMTPEDLRALIALTQDAIEEDVTRRIGVIKASRDGAGLPEQMIRRDICRHECACRYSMRLIEQELGANNGC
jgi:hypothetical protein